jgi:DNA-binding response OmpR family regulator
MAENKGVLIHFLTDVEELIIDFDETRLQQIVSNLMSNAIKFTPRGGHIYISNGVRDNRFILKIKDTGIGIAEADLPHIFDRFYQVNSSHTRQGEGTGIGLALTCELAKLMEGTIKVKSYMGKGAEFEVALPIRNISDFEEPSREIPFMETKIGIEDPVLNADNALSYLTPELQLNHNNGQDRPLVLIADDNEDVRTYIASCLKKEYAIEIAKNGQECEELAFKMTPDLIVLDVMMPYKDGFEVCSTLKTDERTSHIPIIMLTAKADMESKLEGLEQGADAYLTKPFHKKELLLRVKNLLELRQLLQQYYRSSIEIGFLEEDTPTVVSAIENQRKISVFKGRQIRVQDENIPLKNNLDNSFVLKVSKAIEAHLDDAEFDVEQLCGIIALSNSQVHRKLSALTGLSATYFIRYVRLSKAKELLLHSGFKISAIASDCGFNDPAYFSRVFKKEFGSTPQQWRDQNSV